MPMKPFSASTMYWLLNAISLRLRSVFWLQSFDEHFRTFADDFMLLGWQVGQTSGSVQIIQGGFGGHIHVFII
jgi:hypothetical protein